MSRYPSAEVERFDHQFAETESDRNERLRRKRLKATSAPKVEESDLDRLLIKENEIARLMTENMRLEQLVKFAYSDGFSEGMREHTSSKGGKMWSESDACHMLTPPHEEGR